MISKVNDIKIIIFWSAYNDNSTYENCKEKLIIDTQKYIEIKND